MKTGVAEGLEKKHHIHLPADISAWLEGPVDGVGEFVEPGTPDEIWGGMMLPDSLPIAGNGAGDHLCARFDRSGQLVEIVEWKHETAQWLPSGRTFAEAMLVHAILDAADLENGEDEADVFAIPKALASQTASIPAAVVREVTGPGTDRDSRKRLEILLVAGISRDRAVYELTKRALTSDFARYISQVGGGAIAEELGVAWEEFSLWIDDSSLISEDIRRQLASRMNSSGSDPFHQDWEKGAELAERASLWRPDLAWPWAVQARVFLRNGQISRAAEVARKGLLAPGTTAGFTESYVHQNIEAKYCASVLIALPTYDTSDDERDYLAAVQQQEERAFHCSRGGAALMGGHPEFAYSHYYLAGWDRYYFDEMPLVLGELYKAADAMQSDALRALASAHLGGLSRLECCGGD